MTAFPLKIVTPDGLIFDGQAESITLPTTGGAMGILAGHIDCVCPIESGTALIGWERQRKAARCSGGFLAVKGGIVTVIARTFVWDTP